ncbi:hypothetical protein GCM10009127_10010 [Alteraurantiacibacter aestuarii]|uniref:hypothetical protein n=1 Tax=Alteraurantiacibacter aestuarii TaxID=650004 RepID=UPI0031D9BF74
MALSSCGRQAPEQNAATNAAEAATPGSIQGETAKAGITLEQHAGRWEFTYPDGTQSTIILRADGSYERIAGVDSADRGLWIFAEERTCLLSLKAEDRPWCYVIGEANEYGSRTAIMEDGSVVTISPVN